MRGKKLFLTWQALIASVVRVLNIHSTCRKVDIYLFHSDSETVATSYLGIETARGTIGIQPEDPWWPFQSYWDQGTNVTHPVGLVPCLCDIPVCCTDGALLLLLQYFFVIVDANATLTGGEQHQATFRAIRQCFLFSPPDSISQRTDELMVLPGLHLHRDRCTILSLCFHHISISSLSLIPIFPFSCLSLFCCLSLFVSFRRPSFQHLFDVHK